MTGTEEEFDLRTLQGRVGLLFYCYLKDGKPYSLQEVADASGISKAAIGRFRTGIRTKPGADIIIALAKFFGVSADYILGIRNVDETAAELLQLRELMLTGMGGVELRAIHSMPTDGNPMSIAETVRLLAALNALRQSEGYGSKATSP